jgi:DnaK suppressor protein
MNTPFTPGQRAQLESRLVQALQAVEHAMQAEQGSASRAEFASQLLSEEPDAPREHEGDRELALQRADRLAEEQRERGDALLRLRGQGAPYGLCADCGEAVAFDRLLAQPWARRCVACQQRAEAGGR